MAWAREGGDLVDDVVEGVVAGEEELAANGVTAGEADGGALVLIEGAAFGRISPGVMGVFISGFYGVIGL